MKNVCYDGGLWDSNPTTQKKHALSTTPFVEELVRSISPSTTCKRLTDCLYPETNNLYNTSPPRKMAFVLRY